MIDITNDTSFIPPLVLAAFLATVVGNLFNHGVSHSRPVPPAPSIAFTMG